MRGDHRVRERSDHERDIRKTNKQTKHLYLILNVMGSHWRV